jgi:hypothetical protein
MEYVAGMLAIAAEGSFLPGVEEFNGGIDAKSNIQASE